MKNKILALSSAALASLVLFACDGGGGNKPAVTEKGLSISFVDPETPYIYGDYVKKEDLIVKIEYSDGSSKILKDSDYGAYNPGTLFTPATEIKFPIPLEYSVLGEDTKASLNIFTGTFDKMTRSKTIYFDIEKYYKFNDEAGILDPITVLYDEATKLEFKNTITDSFNDFTYEPNDDSCITVDKNTGVVKTTKDFDDFEDCYVSAYLDGIKVNQYFLAPFGGELVDVKITNDEIECSASDRASYSPNSGNLYIPGVYNNSVIRQVANNGFSGCTSLKNIEFPSNLISIGDNAFDGCTNIKDSDTTIVIPENVKYIGSYAFRGATNIKFDFKNPNDWYCRYYNDKGVEVEEPVASKYLENPEYAKLALTDSRFYDCKYFKR